MRQYVKANIWIALEMIFKPGVVLLNIEEGDHFKRLRTGSQFFLKWFLIRLSMSVLSSGLILFVSLKLFEQILNHCFCCHTISNCAVIHNNSVT
ncbi:hypothetical protein Mal48_23430 [Thalassoglobus polymorphus]|uniref:Uncharacterized protein n=1 Tax=Thalassoglobus polymorphus TaxID=2527994 RepID=A0A517QN77_9PLAN|nr:hypothetical protein Mal48_23430 [Thalassoglobus polymorphus]